MLNILKRRKYTVSKSTYVVPQEPTNLVHIVITGSQGSGKTTLIRRIKKLEKELNIRFSSITYHKTSVEVFLTVNDRGRV